MSTASSSTTQGIRVTVEPQYLATHSDPDNDRYVFVYTVVISNDGMEAAQLLTRHWIITDAQGSIEEVRGPGVVGETPYLAPGEEFRYTSGCVLETPRGTMHGSYQMVRDSGDEFDAKIEAFVLASGSADADRYLN